jgi:hypothetical protein
VTLLYPEIKILMFKLKRTKLFLHHMLKTFEADVRLHPFMTSTIAGGEQSASPFFSTLPLLEEPAVPTASDLMAETKLLPL